MELTGAQSALVVRVYVAALLPILVMTVLALMRKLPRWLVVLYLASFAACAIGWELWFTYGLVDGLDVSGRRPDALNAAIPQHINWLLNSLADAGAIGLLGVWFVWLAFAKTDRAFRQWHWGAFCILLVWFLAQNLWVELYMYHVQLAPGLRLSWAPLAPTGPWFNPVLFAVNGRTVQLQTQLPWLLMTPIYYWLLIRIYNRCNT